MESWSHLCDAVWIADQPTLSVLGSVFCGSCSVFSLNASRDLMASLSSLMIFSVTPA